MPSKQSSGYKSRLRKSIGQRSMPWECSINLLVTTWARMLGCQLPASSINDLAAQLRNAASKRMTAAQLAEARKLLGQLKGELK